MATTGFATATAAADPQTVCTAVEAEADVSICTVVGTPGEAAVTPLQAGATAAVNETTATVVEIDRGTSTGGTWSIQSDGEDSGDIAFDASAATVETAVEAITGVTAVGVTGTGTVADPWIVTYVTPVDAVVVALDAASLTGGDATLTVTTTTVGVDGISATDTAITFDTLVGTIPTELPVKATIGSEVVKVTTYSTTVLTVVRAQDGTSGAIHADDAAITFHAGVLTFPNQVVFRITGTNKAAIDAAIAAVGGLEAASGYPATDDTPGC